MRLTPFHPRTSELCDVYNWSLWQNWLLADMYAPDHIGNPVHGEMTLNQFMWMRPIPGYAQYRAPVDDLYLCSAATHPGGGVTGINGRNASRQVLRDLK